MMSNYFAELLGAFVGDGWMSKTNSGISLFITGNPKDEKEYYKRIISLFKKEFLVVLEPRDFKYWGTYGIYTGRKEIIHKFIEAGMPVGNKSICVKVPMEIKNNKELYIAFLRGLFDTDGCISFSKSYNKNASKWQKEKRHIPRVSITTISKDLAQEVNSMFNNINLNFKIRIQKAYKKIKLVLYYIMMVKKELKNFLK